MKKVLLSYFVIAISVLSCTDEMESTEELKPLNSFSFNLDNESWHPAVTSADSCYADFLGVYSELNNVPFYTFTAYQGTRVEESFALLRERKMEIQIMNVDRPGTYEISETFDDFTSYMKYVDYQPEDTIVYINMATEVRAEVEIEDLLPIEGSGMVGVRGTFSGILYNEQDPLDSLIIDNGQFSFERLGRYDFYHCEQ